VVDTNSEKPQETVRVARRGLRPWLILVIILVAGLCLRALYLAEIAREPTFSHPLYDPQYNDYWARGLVTGDWTLPPDVNDPEIRTTPHGRPPGYPWFLAAVYSVFGVNDWSPRLVQTALGLGSGVLIFLLGRALFGGTVGLVAAALMMSYWAFIYFEGLLTYPAVVVFLLLALALAVRWWAAGRGVWRALAVGLLLGLFGLFRPNGLLYAPVLVAWMAWVAHRHGEGRRWWRSAVAVTIGVVAVLTPGAVRNFAVARDFVFVSSYGGLNFYVGNNAEASCVEPRIPELKDLVGIDNWCCFDYAAIVRGLANKLGRERMTFSEANAYFYRQGLDFVAHHPAEFVKKTAKKALLFWGPREVTNDTVMAYDKRFSRVLQLLPGFPFVVALFALGLALWLRDRRAEKAAAATDAVAYETSVAILLFIVAYFLSVIPFFIAGRYRVPIIPFLLLFGAYGLVRLGRFAAARDGRRFALWGLFALAALRLAYWNPTGYEPSRQTWYLRQALAWTAHGDPDEAIRTYGEAERAGPPSAPVEANLGRLLLERGRIDESIEHLRKALEIAPDDAVAHNNLGYALAGLGRANEAIQHYQAALEAQPGLSITRMNLGNTLAGEGRYAEALEQYGEVARREPENAVALRNMARVHEIEGRWDEAEALYRKTLELAPDSPEAHNGLGYLFERQGRLDEAAAEYEKALALNPGFALALNNLVNVYTAQGDLDKAADIQRRIEAISPASDRVE